MNFKFFICLAFVFCSGMPSHAQWDWENDENVVSLDTSMPSYFFDQNELENRVLAEIDGSVFPMYEEDYAKEISSFPKKLLEDSVIVKGWTYWDTQLKSIVKDISAYSEVKREYAIIILNDASHNAYVTEGGLVMVTTGLLADIESLDELRLVLAHEIAHINHKHPFLAYARMRRAQLVDNIAMVSSAYLTGLIWFRYTTGNSILLKRFNHKREHEDLADGFAFRYMQENSYSLSNGLRFYDLMNRDIEKFKYITGRGPNHILYCSAHPEPAGRIIESKRNENELEQTAEFLENRHLARIRKLQILNLTKSYRETVDVGWHYLLKDNENIEIQQKMLEALNALRFERTANFVFGRILSDGYKIDDELETQIAQVDMSSDEAKNLVRSILKMTDSRGSTPFPLNITYSQMRDSIQMNLYPLSDLEESFKRKVRSNDVSDEFLKTYRESGGAYQAYAKHLQFPGEHALYRVACIPISLEIDRYFLKMDYQEAFERSDWKFLKTKMEDDFASIDLISVQDESIIDSAAAAEFKALNSMFRFTVGIHEMEFEYETLHPAIWDFACFYDLKEIFLFTYYENSNVAFSQVIHLNLYDEKIKQTLYRKVPLAKVAKDSEKYIPKRLTRVYDGVVHYKSHPYEVK